MSHRTYELATAEQVLSMADGRERDVIQGYIRSRPWRLPDQTRERTASRIAAALGDWVDECPRERGAVFCGSGFRLCRSPDTFLTVDVSYMSKNLALEVGPDTRIVEGAPLVAVKLLWVGETYGEIWETLQALLGAGIPMVWVPEQVFRTITVYRPDAEPELFNARQFLDGGSHLPGFRVKVADCF